MSFAAILSASRASADSSAGLRACLHFAGQTLVEYQARQAVRAGADRVLIMVSVITPALSQAVDRLSADGVAVALVRDMISMVRDAPRDMDALLIADGAIVCQGHIDGLAGAEGDALLVADDSRASAPFERIDAGQRWVGLARVSPTLLFGTLDMIGDWDLALTLVRAAVQKGARRITVLESDLLEGRAALVESQQQADLVAQAVTSASAGRAPMRGGIEHYLFVPLARFMGSVLMRMQVPAMQVRIGAMVLAAIALVPLELSWALAGFCLLLVALLLAETADRLDELALRQLPLGGTAFVAPGLALVGVALAGGSTMSVDLALLSAVLMVADRWRRNGGASPWMIMTPGTTLVLLIIAGLFGFLAEGYRVAILAAIASTGAVVLRPRA
ncbi:hypothetical protein C100_12665 [Sphingobium sp. C100]|uniref:hypothetical protein n=1 Tax=Sphingobium sp. C100 TaxID=1207055 RepID=UPI0003D68DFD|nr:hypothetical protein [Sphingobium sp. C100]ETI63404.1 hypothetical protein C100_12665 [Sphingobium sp. C100]